MEPIAPHGDELLKMGGPVVGIHTWATLLRDLRRTAWARHLEPTRCVLTTRVRLCDPGTAGEGAPRDGPD